MKRLSVCVCAVCTWALSGWSETKPLRTINLEQIGYQHVTCEVYWQGEGNYSKRKIEFVDDTHVLVHYATPEICSSSAIPSEKHGLHSAVIDLSGHLVHTYDWQSGGEDVITGPDGHVLVVRPDAVRVADLNFQTIQTISWQEDGFPGVPHPGVRLFHVLVTPSRHGFAIVDRKHASLFTGIPYKEMASTTDSVVASVGDRGFVTWSGFDPGPAVLHVDGVEWIAPAHPSLLSGVVVTGNSEVYGLDRKHNLYRIDQRGDETLIAHLGSLAPGMWNSGFRLDQTLPNASRMLFLSHGVRIAFTDSSGIWPYFRTAVLDLKTSKIVFQYDGHFDDDVSISPDGRLVAVRHGDRLTLYTVP
jgi:hypothetical protein